MNVQQRYEIEAAHAAVIRMCKHGQWTMSVPPEWSDSDMCITRVLNAYEKLLEQTMNNKTGLELITDEQTRQVEKEGYSAAHDDQHVNGELVKAGHAYSVAALGAEGNSVEFGAKKGLGFWPWEPLLFKVSSDPIKNYVKAGALFVAEKKRLERAGLPTDIVETEIQDMADEIDFLLRQAKEDAGDDQ